jgi:hypothetical protein
MDLRANCMLHKEGMCLRAVLDRQHYFAIDLNYCNSKDRIEKNRRK